MNVAIIGTGYVGSVTGAGLAAVGHSVTCFDVNEDKIAAWNSAVLPICEPELDDLVKMHRDKNLFFSSDLAGALRSAEFVFVCVNTPQKETGINQGSFDMQHVDKAARDIAQYAREGVIVVEKSTVPLRTAEQLENVLCANNGGKRFAVISNPEFLAEGTAVKDFLNPDRVLVGAKEDDDWAREKMKELYAWVPEDRLVFSNQWSSELSKLVNNLSLVMRLTTMNSLVELCEHDGADITEVERVVGKDRRLGSSFLRAGIGFGGSCFRKDVSALVYLMHHNYGADDLSAKLYTTALELNDALRLRFVQKMSYHLHSLGGKTVVLLGLAFKPNTDDVRDAPARTIAKCLLDDGAFLRIVDPAAVKHVPKLLAQYEFKGYDARVAAFENPVSGVFAGAHAIALCTEWKVFEEIDFAGVAQLMQRPVWLFDGRNMYDPKNITNAGLNYYGVGRGVFRASK